MAPAFERARQQLFQPFRFSFWWRMAVVALFAGEFSSYNFNFSVPGGRGQGGRNLPWDFREMLPVILLVALALVVVIFLLLYIHSVCRFILFDSVLTGRCRIREDWRRRQGHGLRFFVWLVIYECVLLMVLLILFGLPVLGMWRGGIFAHPAEHIALLILAVFFLIVFFLLFVAVAWVITTFVRDFLVPIMALEDVSVTEAWRVYKPTLLQSKSSTAGYLGFKLLLALGLGIIVTIVSIPVVLILMIPAVMFGIMVALIVATGKLGFVIGLLLAIIGGVVFFALMFSVFGTLSVPVAVFFQSYALYYIGSRYQRLGELLWPEPPAAQPATSGVPPVSPAPA